MKRLLYISFDGLLEPLGQSQVLQYLLEMRRFEPELSIWLLTYEKTEDWAAVGARSRMQGLAESAGIHWKPCIYHRRPRLAASAFDFGHGLALALWLCFRHRISLIHTRSFMASLIGVFLQKIFRCRWIYDIRGYWAEEKVDGGMWSRGSLKYRLCRKFETMMLSAADARVTLTRASLPQLSMPTVVIPTCTDLHRFSRKNRNSTRPCIGYVGSVSFSYDFVPTVIALKKIVEILPQVEFSFLNRDQPDTVLAWLRKEGLAERSTVKRASFEEIPGELEKLSGALFFIKPTFSKIASCPTKLGELLAMEIPVLTNRGVGDVEALLEENRVGICISDFSAAAIERGVYDFIQLLSDPDVGSRCRKLAENFFSAERGAKDYLNLYRVVLAAERPDLISAAS